MTLPVHLVAPGSLDAVAVGGVVRLDGPEGRHAVAVRRTRVGERLTLADGAGRSVEGEVAHVERDSLDVRVELVRDEPEPNPRFVLVQALAKGDRDDQAVEAATECGVDEVVPWQAARSIVQWRGERGEKARRKWDAVLVAATKQSRRTRRPVLGPTSTTADLVARTPEAALVLVLHEDATEPLAGVSVPDAGDVLVVVGPEGGIAPDEVAALEAAGARTVRLGSTVLRASSAGPAALAVLSAASRWR
ncbi:16S rRNA (uracil(1498)-N(3))-methyltransferase [Phycicoccus sonneratiae]|uniref:Ribosomal RNA small subunit methyltransferase E n=1 Tax=Phycicoccus sonneratiae TaxID=2807628 RepID=A0ABS2CHI3_9MICO|nr:16S rRNA (uracil(1498)-N(3))-methyltransferase [Phycicoccus sonneraticus]MBM6398908.1 16S rRNA (uracil(1498)-N(3))-methyltransferase [Phycicoccus sonneraticus]